MKKKILCFSLSIILIIVSMIIGLKLYSSHLYDIKDYDRIINKVSSEQCINSNDLSIVNKSESKEYLMVLLNIDNPYLYNNYSNCVYIFKKDSLFKNKYSFFGSAFSDNDISTYCWDSYNGKEQEIVYAVFGHYNKAIIAKVYLDNKEVYSKQINDNFVCEIVNMNYKSDNMPVLKCYDSEGNEIII